MPKNYYLLKIKNFLINVLRVSKLKVNTNNLFVVLLTLFSFTNVFGQVNITAPNLSISTCSFPSDYSTLPQIQIQESNNANIANQGNGRTIILTAPTNFEFNPGVGTIADRNRDVSNSTIVVTSTTITITYDCNATAQRDRWRINGIQIRAINFASTGDITRTGGNGTVNGLTNGTALTNTLTSTYTPLLPNGGGAANVCVGANTPAFTNSTTGGVWSITNGTGSATVTTGGVVTGVTAGTVNVVYTIGGCSVSSALLINPPPTITSQPSATSTCTTGTATFSVTATGATTYQWRRNGVALTNVAPYSGVNTAALTITNPAAAIAGNFDVVVSNATCSSTSTARALTVNTTPATVTTPVPTNGATNVCYTGSGSINSISWAASAGATSYDVYFGAGSVPGTITANVTTNSYNTGALAANTTYYWRVVARNSCGVAVSSATFTFTTSSAPCYCASSGGNITDGITGVNFNTINNLNTSVNTGYNDYTTLSTTITKGFTYDLNVYINTGGPYTNYQTVYIDWNGNGDFTDAGESYNLGTATNVTNGLTSINPLSITVPPGAITGTVRMRIQSKYNSATTGPCDTGFDGEGEDYSLNIIDIVACTSPTAQPTALNLSVSGTTINGTFTAASPAAQSYLVIANTTGVAPTITNGTAYAIGDVLGGTNFVVDNDTNTSLSASSLIPFTKYYFFIYSMNNICTGGPLYLTTSPLIGNATTSYCTPTGTGSGYPITNVKFGTLFNNNSTATTFYEDFSTITANVTGGSIYNLSVTATGNTFAGNTFYQYAFFDWNNNGSFSDPGETYLLGSYNTLTATFNKDIIIPPDAYVGKIRMRVANSFYGILSPCATAGYFQMEDYSLNVAKAPDCTVPTAQPTALVLTPGATSIAGSFTAASPASQNYLVIMNSTGVAPTSQITNGTTYTIGSSIGVSNTVIDTDNNTTFTAAGLNTNTTYYFFIYSMSALCIGGPLYNTNPTVLIGNATTTGTPPAPCIPSTIAPNNVDRYIDRVAFIGTMVETNNTSTYSTTTPGYEDFTGLATKAVQAQGEGVNMIVESIGGRAKLKVWVDWNKDGVFDESELVYNPGTAGISSTFGFVIPTGTVPGNYRIRVRTFNSFYDDGNPANGSPDEYFGYNFNACEPFNTGTVSTYTSSQYGEAEDYLFTVIERSPTNISTTTGGQVCNSGTVTLSATGTAGTTEYHWYASATGGSQLTGSPTTGSWTTPNISATTTYYVASSNGTTESLVRKPVVAKVNPTPTLTFTPTIPEVCGQNAEIVVSASGDKEVVNLLSEDFEAGGLGAFTNVNSDATSSVIQADTKWTNRPSTFVPTAGVSWKPAISTGLAPNDFALATSDSATPPYELVENSLVSGTLNSTNYLNLTMTLKFYYSRYYPDGTNPDVEFASIEISTDGGMTWTPLQTFTADTGIGTVFTNLTYDLSAYINKTNLKIRFLHHSLGSVSGWLPDGVAVDDVLIYGEKPLSTNFAWSSSTSSIFASDCVSPPPPGGSSSICLKPLPGDYETKQVFNLQATALLSNSCDVTGSVLVPNNNKIWNVGSSDWNTASWLPNSAIPDITKCVIIKQPVVLNSGANGFARNVTVEPGGSLQIMGGKTLTVDDFLVNNSTADKVNLESDANLLQNNATAVNVGSITAKRLTGALRNNPGTAVDYVYWGSPVLGQQTKGAGGFSPGTPNAYFFSYRESNDRFYETTDPTFVPGKGYAVRAEGGSKTYTFQGKPNNGDISYSLAKSADTPNTVDPSKPYVHGYNLVANPYPSNIDFNELYLANSSLIYNTAWFWTNNVYEPVQQGSKYNGNNYSVINGTGGVTSTYSTYTGSVASNGIIKVGQGFIVQAKGSGTLNFKNSYNTGHDLRTGSAGVGFFQKGAAQKNRFWLTLTNPNNIVNTQLIGYIAGATDGFEQDYDNEAFDDYSDLFYSSLAGKKLLIQGKSENFTPDDTVDLGTNISLNGTYTIALEKGEGIFASGQNIYLKDKANGTVTNLSQNNYVFQATSGLSENRFEIIYKPEEVLSTGDVTQDNLWIYRDANDFVVKASQKIKALALYDASGRLILTTKPAALETKIDGNRLLNGVFVLKINLANGEEITRKIRK
ncbi:hypothetical protein SAMN05421847_2541 [Halpernia humi]|uniref:Fibronectin type-III domain-containing protein n=1 Tax=Halpernia humi TaxID=493375 RepID=A0A1H6AR11_9FLAO|nr:GEVED domain-containing protein [Halpernia humi]SEG50495.1 hypothetical protein SAMN05421847_2541 [Halpernia humi]